MKINYRIFIALSLITVLFLPGCSLAAGIFKAGFWSAIIVIVLIIGLGIYAFKKMID